IAGHYPPAPGESSILGMEVSGVLSATGEPVCALLAGGGHAETVAVPEGQVFPAPSSIPLVHSAAIPEAFLTAFVNLRHEANLVAGETLLVHAGASGVGLAAISLGKFPGARVPAPTRTAEKSRRLRRSRAEKGRIVKSFREEILPAFDSGTLRVFVDSLYPPEQAVAAFTRMRENKNTGKLIIDWTAVKA